MEANLVLTVRSCFLIAVGKQRPCRRTMKNSLGTYQVTSENDIYAIVDAALAAGYRFIDTAQVYKNEEYIGRALKELLPKYGLARFVAKAGVL